jgi:hypothetical protein
MRASCFLYLYCLLIIFQACCLYWIRICQMAIEIIQKIRIWHPMVTFGGIIIHKQCFQL